MASKLAAKCEFPAAAAAARTAVPLALSGQEMMRAVAFQVQVGFASR